LPQRGSVPPAQGNALGKLFFAGLCGLVVAVSLARAGEEPRKPEPNPDAAKESPEKGDGEKPKTEKPDEKKDEKTEPKKRPFTATSRYEVREILGWKVRVHPRLVGDKTLCEHTLRLLESKLYDVIRVIPQGPADELRKIEIWVEFNDPAVVCMCYHPSRHWLEEHGLNPEKAKAVEIGNARTFLSWTIVQPSMVLHELAHGYHFRVLGSDNEEVAAAYRRAVESKSYESVLYYDGAMKRAYALNDVHEYFAETSESYFGTNDFYPFVRPELLKHDPKGAEMLKKVWRLEPPKPKDEKPKDGEGKGEKAKEKKAEEKP
jgi:hypothetical protein